MYIYTSILVEVEGLEPSTFCVSDRLSNQLRYTSYIKKPSLYPNESTSFFIVDLQKQLFGYPHDGQLF